MSTVNQPNKRIFTIVGREGTAVVTDSKINPATNCGNVSTFKGEDTQLECLKALNKILSIVPQDVRLSSPVVFLLPNHIAFLRYEDTRAYWLKERKTKAGKEIAPSLLVEVDKLDKLLKALGSRVQLFDQSRLKSSLYISYKDASWKVLNKMVPKKEATDVNEAF